MTSRTPRTPLTISRRRLLAGAGLAAAGVGLAACSRGPEKTAQPTRGAAADNSAAEKTITWGNWLSYIDTNDDTGARPTLDAFTAATGIAVSYQEDVLDNRDFFNKLKPKLEAGDDPGYDIAVLTDWMAGVWIADGYAQKFDKQRMPNAANVLPALADVSFDPGRQYSLPYQSGFGVVGWNTARIQKYLGVDRIDSLDQMFDPRLKGRVAVLSEMRDTMGLLLAYTGANPSDFTEDQYAAAIEVLTRNVDSGQIRDVVGNDYLAGLASGEIAVCLGWSGDIAQLGDGFGLAIPETGGTLWTDNYLIPAGSHHKANAETLINHYYDPKVAAEVAAYVQYMCPVEGAREAMQKIDPALVDNVWIFPTDEMLSRAHVFMPLTAEQDATYQAMFETAIGI